MFPSVLAPIRELGAKNMIQQIRGGKILEGFRGQPPRDLAIAECIERLSQLSMELEDVQELDVNPLLAFEKGCKAVDARVIISPPLEDHSSSSPGNRP